MDLDAAYPLAQSQKCSGVAIISMLSPQKRKETYYPFLDLLDERQAIAQGASLSDKANYVLYRAIQKSSHIRNAAQNELFSLDRPVDGLVDATREEIMSHLRKLLNDKLICQIFYLRYKDSELKLFPCYLSVTALESPSSVFASALSVSIVNIDTMLQSLGTPSVAALKKAFQDDFKKKKVDAKTHPEVLIDPFSALRKENFDFPPAPSLIEASIDEMKKELLAIKKLSDIKGYGLMLIRKADILHYLEAAEDILREDILGYYQRKNETLKSLVNQIFLEESIYEIDSSAVDTTEFIQRLAEAVKSVGLYEADSLGRYPGAFVVEVIITFAKRAKVFIQEKLSEKNVDKYREYREQISHSRGAWKDSILVISEKEKTRLHAETWDYLSEDEDIVSVRWELEEGSVWVFVKKDLDTIFEIVMSIEKEEDFARWQTLAIREILDEYEDDFSEIFKNSEFVAAYGRILRKAYTKYIPWYYPILFLLRIKLFLDYAYKKAKLAIREEQESYSLANESRRQSLKKEQEDIKKTSIEQVENLSLINKVLSALDYFYFKRKTVPDVQDIHERARLQDLDKLRSIIKENKFQLSAPLSRDTPWQNSILLYPRDRAWDIRRARLKKLAEEVLLKTEKLNKESQSRFKRLLSFIKEDIRSRQKKIKREEKDETYRNFDSSLQKHELLTKKKEEEGKAKSLAMS